MSGPQFAHIQTWSRKGNRRGQSIAYIIAEATRQPEASQHVDAPSPPRILLGDPNSFAADHAAHVDARATIAKMKDGTERRRAIREDRHTMASVVMSYPVPRAAIVTDKARQKYAAWERRNLAWLAAEYGSQVRVVLAHDDETYGHLHAWILPDDPDADATTLHPGKVAKKKVEAAAKAAGDPPRLAVKKGNKALSEEMSRWQDAYHAAVGAPEGLTRLGPKKQRLSREQWKAQKASSVATAASLKRAQEADADADRIQAAAAANARAHAIAFEALAVEIEEGTLRRSDKGTIIASDPGTLRAGGPEVLRAASALVQTQERLSKKHDEIGAALNKAKQRENAAIMAEASAVEREQEAASLVMKLKRLLSQVTRLLARPDLPTDAVIHARHIEHDAEKLLPPQETSDDSDGPRF